MKKLQPRLIIFNFLEFAVWGAYLVSIGTFLARSDLAKDIFWFFAIQGIVSLFMPMIVSHVADKYMDPRKVLSLCHLVAALMKSAAVAYCIAAPEIKFWPLFILFGISIAFYIPTIGVGNALAMGLLRAAGLNTVKAFPPIRIFGTIGFITAMLMVNFIRFDGVQLQLTCYQLALSAIFGFVLAGYVLTLPKPAPGREIHSRTPEVSGYLELLRNRNIFWVLMFTFLLGVCLQITNGYGNPYITSFQSIAEFADTWASHNANAILFLSQVSESLCILMIPFCLKWFGIKRVIICSALCWMLRFFFLGLGDTGSGLAFIILSMIVYGVAFDFINIAGAIYLDAQAPRNAKNRVQGLFMLVMSGLGAAIGMPLSGMVVNRLVYSAQPGMAQLDGWHLSWFVFAGYALVVALAAMVLFPGASSRKACEIQLSEPK